MNKLMYCFQINRLHRYFRLLREMGWNEADQEDYEITEDEKKEFQNLSKQVQ